MANISQINGLKITAESASYAGTASLLLGSVSSAISSSYATTASVSLTVSSSIVTDTSDYRVALYDINSQTIRRTSGINILYTPDPGRLSVPQITVTGITGSFSGSISTATTAATASYVNTLNQNVTVNGNLTINGTASYTHLTASQLNVANNTISVNTGTPAVRFGGLLIYDSGSTPIATASFLWDSLNNRFIYQNASGSTYSGGMLLSGPRNTGSLGDEQSLTNGKIAKSTGGDHLGDSIISEVSGTIQISGSTSVTGSMLATAGFTGSLFGTASYANQALTASYALTSPGGGGATFPYTGNAVISGSLTVTSSGAFLNGLSVTRSFTIQHPTIPAGNAMIVSGGSVGFILPFSGVTNPRFSIDAGQTTALEITGTANARVLLGDGAGNGNATTIDVDDSTADITIAAGAGNLGLIGGTVTLQTLTQSPQSNVVTIDTSTGRLYYTASSALAGGGGGLSGGTTNYVPLWTSATSLGSSIMSYHSGNNEITVSGSLHVSGTLFVAGEIEGIQGQVTALAQGNFLFSGF